MNCLLLLALLAADGPTISGSTHRAVSANFEVECRSTTHDARRVAQSCEEWRERLLATWRPQDADAQWKVSCQVVVHASRQSYLSAVGRGGEATFGSSLLDFAGKHVSKRRIDLLPDQAGELSALGHELTHVVVADYFGGQQLPRWADEGMAILADSHEKRRLHHRDLKQAVAQQKSFHAAELLALRDYPSGERIPAFYGQSAWLVACLCKRDKPARFLEFVQRAMQEGHEKSIREVYGLRGHAELEQLWRTDLQTGEMLVLQEPERSSSAE